MNPPWSRVPSTSTATTPPLPPDLVADVSRSETGPFEFKTLLPVDVNLLVEFYKLSSEAKGPGTWASLELVFATRWGNIRRNSLTDFENINRNGKIAMKLDAEWGNGGDRIVSVAIAKPGDDVVLTTAQGQCIRFLISDEVRLFKGRDSTGVRGIRLAEGDEVIAMAIVNHMDATPDERAAYLKQATAMRRATGDEDAETYVFEVEP